MGTASSDRFEFDGLQLDRRRRSLTDVDGNEIDVTPKAFDALVYFLERPGQVLDRATLLDALWPDTVVEENNLSQAVAALRRALGEGFIVTVPRRGYQFVADVRPNHDAAGAVSPHAEAVESAIPSPVRLARAGVVPAAARSGAAR